MSSSSLLAVLAGALYRAVAGEGAVVLLAGSAALAGTTGTRAAALFSHPILLLTTAWIEK